MLCPDKILLIACYFPPSGGIQVQRALSLARYLPRHGFQIHVLTVRNPAVPTLDPALLQLLPDSVQVHRTWTLEPPFQLRKKLWSKLSSQHKKGTPKGDAGRWRHQAASWVADLLAPDPQRLWHPTALPAALRLVRTHGIGNVVITAPPFSSFLIARKLKAAYPKIRLILDIRDEWLEYFVNQFAFRNADRMRERAAGIEQESVRLADAVVSVTTAARDAIRGRYPAEAEGKFHIVRNGFDPDTFAGFTPRTTQSDRIRVCYAGTVYGPADPSAYLDALDRLPEQYRSRFQTVFVGRIAEEFDRSVFANRKSEIRILPFVPQASAIRHMEEADLLLLPWTDRLNVPGKAFEYIATGTPILALVPKHGEVEHIIQQTGTGFCADPADGVECLRLLEFCASSPENRLTSPVKREIQKFARPELTAQYAALIRSLGQSSEPLALDLDDQPAPELT